jgi:aminopeptidase N
LTVRSRDGALQIGNHEIIVSYSAPYSSNTLGINKDSSGIIFTHFEPIHAREAFPCFDEPAFRAPFNLTLRVNAGTTVLSNSLKQSESYGDLVVFERTETIPSYQLAFAAGDFACQAEVGPVRIFSLEPEKNHNFALDVALGCIKFFEKYFGSKLPLQKLDLLAVPKMIAGAMENPGLLIFQADSLLITRETTFVEKIHTALTIAHEIAHQWFGNSVSISWWSDMWVKEAFATLLQHLAIDEIYPDWNIFEWFFSRFTRTAFKSDFVGGTVLKEIAPGKEHEAFNPLSYSKGATILLHLQQKLGKDTFRNRVRALVNEKAGNTITTEDVMESLGEKESLMPWLKQEGYPIVTVTVVNWVEDNLTIEISQRSSVNYSISNLHYFN